MPDKLYNNIKHFLEDKPSLRGEEMWNNWYNNPENNSESEVLISSSKSKLRREVNAIKKNRFGYFLTSKKMDDGGFCFVCIRLVRFFI